MWNMSLPWWEFGVRAVIVYGFLLVLLRVTGKRQIGQLAPFDLVLLLVLSNAVQNAMNGGDNSVIGGVLSAVTLVAINWSIGYLTYKSKRIEAWVEGRPTILIHNGRTDHKAMNSVRMTIHELNSALRAEGCTGPEDVQYAILENNGQITVVQQRKKEEP